MRVTYGVSIMSSMFYLYKIVIIGMSYWYVIFNHNNSLPYFLDSDETSFRNSPPVNKNLLLHSGEPEAFNLAPFWHNGTVASLCSRAPHISMTFVCGPSQKICCNRRLVMMNNSHLSPICSIILNIIKCYCFEKTNLQLTKKWKGGKPPIVPWTYVVQWL